MVSVDVSTYTTITYRSIVTAYHRMLPQYRVLSKFGLIPKAIHWHNWNQVSGSQPAQGVNNNVAVSKLPSAVQVASPLPEYPSLHATATVSVVVLVPVPPLVLSLLLFATSIEAQVAAAA